MENDSKHKEILDAVGALTEKTDEVLEAIGHFSNKTEERFLALESDLSSVKSDLSSVKSQMVTKDYLDDKLADLKGDLTVLMRKEDKKLVALVHVLESRKVITPEDVNMILALEPFPQN